MWRQRLLAREWSADPLLQLFQRADDTEETMKSRLSVYEDSTRPLIDYYQKAGLYTEVDGRQAIDKVTKDLVETLKG